MISPVEQHLAWGRHRGLRPSTLLQRRFHLQRLDRWLARSRRCDLLTADGEALQVWQMAHGHLKPQTRRTMVGHARAFYTWAAWSGLASHTLLRYLVAPKVPHMLPHPTPEDDLAAALINAPDRIRPWLLLGAFGGLRACEVAPLRAEELDLRARRMLVTGKGGKQRIVPLSRFLVAELEACRLPRKGWLFPARTRQGEPIPSEHVSAGQVSHLASRFLHEMGSRESFHGLRHYAGTRLNRATGNLRYVQEFLGHATLTMAALYSEVNRTELADAVDQAFDET